MNSEGVRDNQITVAFGPELPNWGSWQWVGEDLLNELGKYKYFKTASFSGMSIPKCDVVCFVKHPPRLDVLQSLPVSLPIIYCPVDFFGGAAGIEGERVFLRRCTRILVHCKRLRKYFEPYACVEYMDHHVKFVAPMSTEPRRQSYILWVGVRTNLPSLVTWINRNPLPEELRVLTNFEDPNRPLTPRDMGLESAQSVKLENWSRDLHLEWCANAKAVIDIKNDDFRSRHKPPAKAIDFIASGLPLAMNSDSSPVEHLAELGFDVPSPSNREYWLSREYWEETQRFGRALRELLSLKRIGRRFRSLILQVLAERRNDSVFSRQLS